LDWRSKVELYEQIRPEYEFGAGSIIGVARKLGVHRRTVREAVRSALPARRKKTERPYLKIAPAVSFIDEVLAVDRKAPRKQRHTAKRIWERIRLEVRDARRPSGRFASMWSDVSRSRAWDVARLLCLRVTSLASRSLDGERIKLQVFSMRSMASGAAYHRAYLRATQQAFLEAHELAFHYFGGVFRKLRYDNLTSAVVEALELGCTDVAAIRHLLMADQLQHVAQVTIEIGVLAAYERPLPTMIEYNQLLSAGINGVQA
jgi:hypothetical protein